MHLTECYGLIKDTCRLVSGMEWPLANFIMLKYLCASWHEFDAKLRLVLVRACFVLIL